VKRQSTVSICIGDFEMSDVDMATIQLKGAKQSFILSGEKNFKTGSKGYHAQGKMQIGDKNYQINILAVEIGSKPKEKEKK
jgi:hypothetical protein